ncbi:MAG TPA: ABC transporter permease [Candidatus Dormibacteraeota bacterium]|nr:ABC transporter permease [Candidatus Dormibacteraeota bacterium]
MRFAWLVARRYLRSPYKPAVLRLVTVFSVVGIAAGVATLVIALAMNTGFRLTIQDRLLGVSAHVNLLRPGAEGIENYRALAERLSHVDDVKSVAPAIYLTVLLSGTGRARGVVIKGIDPKLEERTDEALRHIVAGAADFTPDADGFDSIVVGHLMAEELGIHIGDYVTLTSPEGRLTPYGMVPRSRRFRVTGVFNSGFYDYDANWAFATLSAAQNLAGVGNVASVLEFRIHDVNRAVEAARAIGAAAGPGFTTTTWQDENRALFRALHLEKLVTALFIGLITFVAGLNILVVLAMTVTDRAKDIAVLMSLGAFRPQVRNIFMLQGLTVGVIGTITGLIAGYTLSWAAGTYHLIPLDPQVYSVPYLPFHSSPLDGVWIAGVAIAISVAATLIPARAASRILPVDILRYE